MVNRIPYNTNVVADLIRLLCHTQGMDDEQITKVLGIQEAICGVC